MKFSLSTLLVAFLVIGAFFAGWILPPPNTDKSLTPVLIATRDLPYRTTLRDSDFRAVYMKIDNVPDLAARNLNQVEDSVTTNRVRCNGLVYLDEITPTDTRFHNSHVPPGKKVVAIKTAEDFDTLTWYLLSEGDVVSIYIDDADQQSETRTCLIPRCTVHSKLNETPSMIGVWLTERESKLVNDAQEQGVKMSLAGAE